MATIGFIGLGNMGSHMARNLIRSGHKLKLYDINDETLQYVAQAGAKSVKNAADAATEVEVVITMLPVGADVRSVLQEAGVIDAVAPGTVLIDSSTIDVDSARAMHQTVGDAGYEFLDAPVSGGVARAEAGTLTFMCGGDPKVFDKCRPILEDMGKNVLLCGGPGQGQVSKICNNMIAGITMLALSEAFVLGESLGIDRETLLDVLSKSTGNSAVLDLFCPVSGVKNSVPANNDYNPGFAAGLMLKDLRLAQSAAASTGVSTPLGAAATAAYAIHEANGLGHLDMSSIIKLIKPDIK